MKKKIKIGIEEHFVKEFLIEAEGEDMDEIIENAMSIAEKQYEKGELKIRHGKPDFKLMAVTQKGKETEWTEF